MANFSNPAQTGQPNDYTRVSEGPRAAANDAIGTLFEGLNKTAALGIQEADRQERSNIQDDILSQTDVIRGEFGVKDATDVQSDAEEISSKTRPAALDRAYANLDTFQNAYVKGALSESHYWARLNVMVRQLRAKYPGYRQDIDNMVASVVGAKPANALQSALFSEWQSAKSDADSSANRMELFEEAAAKDGTLPVDYYQRQAEGNPYSFTELKGYVANKNRIKADVQARQAELSLQIDQNNVQQKDLENSFRTDATQFVTTLLQDGSKTFGKTYQEAYAKVAQAQADIAAGKPINEAELQTLRGQIGELQTQARDQLNKLFLSSWDGDPAHTYVGHINKETQTAIIDQAMQPIQLLADAFSSTGNPYAIAGATQAIMEAQKTTLQNQILQALPAVRNLSAVKDLVGPDALGLYLQANPKAENALTKALIDYSSTSAALGQGTVTQALDLGEKAGQSTDYFNGLSTRWANLALQIDGGKVPLAMIQQNVQYMFSDQSGQMAKLDDASRYKWFNDVASPVVTEHMLKLKKMGDTQSWNTYQDWVKSNFVVLFQQSAKTLQAADQSYGTNNPAMFQNLVTWDDTSNTFKVATTPSMSSGNVLGDAARTVLSLPGVASVQMDVNKLNAAIQTVKPIIEENGGDVKTELALLFHVMGVDKIPGIPQAMSQELMDQIQQENPPKDNK